MRNAIAHQLLTGTWAAIHPSQPASPVYILAMMFYDTEYPFGQFGSACSGRAPSQLFVLLHTSKTWEAEKSLIP